MDGYASCQAAVARLGHKQLRVPHENLGHIELESEPERAKSCVGCLGAGITKDEIVDGRLDRLDG